MDARTVRPYQSSEIPLRMVTPHSSLLSTLYSHRSTLNVQRSPFPVPHSPFLPFSHFSPSFLPYL